MYVCGSRQNSEPDDELSSASAEGTGLSDVYRNASGNRFPSGQHKKSSKIPNNPVLDMEIFMLATQQVLNIQFPNWEIAWDFGCAPLSRNPKMQSPQSLWKCLKGDIDSRAT